MFYNIILNLIKKIIKRKSFVRDEIINFLKDDYFDDMKKVVDDKNKELEVIEYQNKKKKKEFLNVKAGDMILAKYLNPGQKEEDNPHLYRPFFVVGRSEKELYCIYCTTQPYFTENYYKCELGKTSYLDCSNIISISFEDFSKSIKKIFVKEEDKKNIIKKMLNYNNEFEKIDFKMFFESIGRNSIIMYENNFYKVIDLNDKGFFVKRLIFTEKNNNLNNYITILGKNCRISGKEEFILRNEDIVVITNKSDSHSYRISKQNMDDTFDLRKLKLGDILSLKNSKNKMIFVANGKKGVYCVSFDALDFFTGLTLLKRNLIDSYYASLNDSQLSILASKLYKALKNDSLNTNDEKVKNTISRSLVKKR